MIKIAVFDVFDTSLTRLVGSPHSVFMLLAGQMRACGFLTCSEAQFVRLRVRAERQARHQARTGEVTLEQIYNQLGELLHFDHARQLQVMTMELELERQLLLPVPGAYSRVQKARGTGKRIVYASDMYLPHSLIQEQLEHYGFLKDGDLCYVSCDFEGTKATGDLFRQIMKDESVSSFEIEHIGNDFGSDVRGAAYAGVRASHFDQGNLNRFEQLLESFVNDTRGFSSILAGASRLARLENSSSEPHEQAISDVTAGVVGPVLTSYVSWVLRRAAERNVKRLYFVSRDGQILFEIARTLTASLKLDIDCRYLYGSRQAWHLASLKEEICEADLQWMLEPTEFYTVRSALRRVNLSPEDVEDELKSVKLDPMKWEHHLSHDQRDALRSLILMPTVQNQILDNAARSRALALGYLRQEGLFDDTEMGIVDLGWLGRQMRSLSKILAEEGGALPTPYYLGFIASDDEAKLPERETYLFDVGQRTGLSVLKLQPGFYKLLEVFCTGDEGTVEGYVQENGSFAPRLRAPTNEHAIDWGLPQLRKTLTAFVSYTCQGLEFVETNANTRPMVQALIAEFWEHPNPIEALAWGSYPYDDDQAGSYRSRLAAPIDQASLKLAVRDMREWRRRRPIWLAGSVELSHTKIRLPLKLIMKAWPALGYLRHTFAKSNFLFRRS